MSCRANSTGLSVIAANAGLPTPTGKFPLGTVALPLSAPNIQLWYPAAGSSTPQGPRYDPDSSWRSSHWWRRVDAGVGVALAAARHRYPVLLFLPGWAGRRADNTALVQELASHGFVVVAIGYQDATCPPQMDLTTPTAFAATCRRAQQRLTAVASGCVSVIDALSVLNQADPVGRFTDRLNLTRLGVIGHSFGGTIAVQLAAIDPRVTAVVDIDGWLFDAAPNWIKQPFLFIADDPERAAGAHTSADDPVRRHTEILATQTTQRWQRGIRDHGGWSVTIRGAQHDDFADFVYLGWRASLLGRKPDGSAIRQAARCATLVFAAAWDGASAPELEQSSDLVRVELWQPHPCQL